MEQRRSTGNKEVRKSEGKQVKLSRNAKKDEMGGRKLRSSFILMNATSEEHLEIISLKC